jgi:hypothetical protein
MAGMFSMSRGKMHEFTQRAAELLAAGLTIGEVESLLVKEGADRVSAAKITTTCAHVSSRDWRRYRSRSHSGRRNIIAGFLMCVGGFLATIVSYHAGAPGGTYTIWTAAVLLGGALFIKGLFDTAEK